MQFGGLREPGMSRGPVRGNGQEVEVEVTMAMAMF